MGGGLSRIWAVEQFVVCGHPFSARLGVEGVEEYGVGCWFSDEVSVSSRMAKCCGRFSVLLAARVELPATAVGCRGGHEAQRSMPVQTLCVHTRPHPLEQYILAPRSHGRARRDPSAPLLQTGQYTIAASAAAT